jgi:hypothetical protein
LKPGITTPNIVCCPDGHFRHAIYSLGPYIADYPEQALLAYIIQGWCPKFVFVYYFLFPYSSLTRCTAQPEDLEGPLILHHCEHTKMLVEAFELGDLWDDYGVVSDIVVESFLSVCPP